MSFRLTKKFSNNNKAISNHTNMNNVSKANVGIIGMTSATVNKSSLIDNIVKPSGNNTESAKSMLDSTSPVTVNTDFGSASPNKRGKFFRTYSNEEEQREYEETVMALPASYRRDYYGHGVKEEKDKFPSDESVEDFDRRFEESRRERREREMLREKEEIERQEKKVRELEKICKMWEMRNDVESDYASEVRFGKEDHRQAMENGVDNARDDNELYYLEHYNEAWLGDLMNYINNPTGPPGTPPPSLCDNESPYLSLSVTSDKRSHGDNPISITDSMTTPRIKNSRLTRSNNTANAENVSHIITTTNVVNSTNVEVQIEFEAEIVIDRNNNGDDMSSVTCSLSDADDNDDDVSTATVVDTKYDTVVEQQNDTTEINENDALVVEDSSNVNRRKARFFPTAVLSRFADTAMSVTVRPVLSAYQRSMARSCRVSLVNSNEANSSFRQVK